MARNLKDTIDDAMEGELEVDFSEARSSNFEPLPPGPYDVFVAECTKGLSKEGNPKVVFKFELEEPLDGYTKTVFRHAPASGEGSGILRDTLRELGFDVDNMTTFDPADAVDLKATITVRFQKNNPEYNEITKIKGRVAKRAAAKPAARRSRKLS